MAAPREETKCETPDSTAIGNEWTTVGPSKSARRTQTKLAKALQRRMDKRRILFVASGYSPKWSKVVTGALTAKLPLCEHLREPKTIASGLKKGFSGWTTVWKQRHHSEADYKNAVLAQLKEGSSVVIPFFCSTDVERTAWIPTIDLAGISHENISTLATLAHGSWINLDETFADWCVSEVDWIYTIAGIRALPYGPDPTSTKLTFEVCSKCCETKEDWMWTTDAADPSDNSGNYSTCDWFPWY